MSFLYFLHVKFIFLRARLIFEGYKESLYYRTVSEFVSLNLNKIQQSIFTSKQ